MSPLEPLSTRQECNAVRYRPGDEEGHYESYFQRANHPGRPLAFWIRHTIFSPRNRAAFEILSDRDAGNKMYAGAYIY